MIFFWFLCTFVKTDFIRSNIVRKRDAGASRIGSHAGAWEPEKIFIGIQTFRFGLCSLESNTSKSKGLDSNA